MPRSLGTSLSENSFSLSIPKGKWTLELQDRFLWDADLTCSRAVRVVSSNAVFYEVVRSVDPVFGWGFPKLLLKLVSKPGVIVVSDLIHHFGD